METPACADNPCRLSVGIETSARDVQGDHHSNSSKDGIITSGSIVNHDSGGGGGNGDGNGGDGNGGDGDGGDGDGGDGDGRDGDGGLTATTLTTTTTIHSRPLQTSTSNVEAPPPVTVTGDQPQSTSAHQSLPPLTSLPDISSADQPSSPSTAQPATSSTDKPGSTTDEPQSTTNGGMATSMVTAPSTPSPSTAPPLSPLPTDQPGNTLSTSIVTVTGSTSSVPTTTATPAVPAASSVPIATIAGSVGGGVGVLALLGLLLWFLRRRRVSEGTSLTSFFHSGPRQATDEKPIVDTTGMAVGVGDYDVFAEFGGRAQSQEVNRSLPPSRGTNIDGGWSLRTKDTSPEPTFTTAGCEQPQPIVKPMMQAVLSPAHHPVQQPTPLQVQQPNSQPFTSPVSPETSPNALVAELDSADTELSTCRNNQESTRSDPGFPFPRQPSYTRPAHPSPLMPGTPGTQMAIQSPVSDAVTGSNTNVNSDANKSRTYLPYRSSANANPDVPRATLNATTHERDNNQYANSWAQLP